MRPLSLPPWSHPQVRLVEEDPACLTYAEAYEVNCLRYGREVDLPITLFKRRLANSQGVLPPFGQQGAASVEAIRNQKLAAYQEVGIMRQRSTASTACNACTACTAPVHPCMPIVDLGQKDRHVVVI